MSGKTILVWFRNDLRIHDNEILLEAVKRSGQIVPVYCFDPRYFEVTKYGTKRTGILRAKFLLESVEGLKESLKQLGGDLIIRQGKPEDVLPEICKQYDVSEVYHHREVASLETDISALVESALWKKQINLRHFIGHTMYHKEDLPFPIKNIPDDFAVFRKKIERDAVVKPCFDTPSVIRIPADMETGSSPSLEDLGFDIASLGNLEINFKGGEQEGLLKLNELLSIEEPKVKTSKNSLGSSRLSPWLSLGCLSSREVYWAVKKHKAKGESSVRILTELQWRDFFRFMLKKHSNTSLEQSEPEKDMTEVEQDRFLKWQKGETGNALADACMHELNVSGFLNEKVKHYVSSFLYKDLAITWRAGAAYLEEKAIDYSPASDWANWAYLVDGGIMSSNKPLVAKTEEIAEDLSIKRWILEQSA